MIFYPLRVDLFLVHLTLCLAVNDSKYRLLLFKSSADMYITNVIFSIAVGSNYVGMQIQLRLSIMCIYVMFGWH